MLIAPKCLDLQTISVQATSLNQPIVANQINGSIRMIEPSSILDSVSRFTCTE
jgi:hypothetical protein